MGFDASNKKVYDLLNDKMYSIAPNQRKYVWTRNNWQELLTDIDLVVQERTNNHFIGSIILKKETINDGIRNHFSIIDGQQRISTLTILLCAIGYLFVDQDRQDLFNGLYKPLYVYDNKNQKLPIVSERANKSISSLVKHLFFKAEQHFETFVPWLSVEQLLSIANVTPEIKECFCFFYEELKNRMTSGIDALVRYRNIIDDIRYIDIVAEEDEDAFTIFEILNARGQVLTDFELLNNFILKCALKEQKEEARIKLEQISSLLGKDIEVFLKHYAMHKYGTKTDKGENRPYKIITRMEKLTDKMILLNDILLKAQYYQKMTTYRNCSEIEQKVFSFFKPRRQQQFRPIVLGLMHQKDLGSISESCYNQNIEFLYEFFICYHVIGEQTSNKIEDVVYTYSQKIENSFTQEVLSAFRESMIKRIPSKDNFRRSILRICYSHRWKAYSDNRKRENVSAIFEVIERELGYNGQFDNCTVEHCLPDAESEDNARIGNLMLLEDSINAICSNKPLNQKIALYKSSALKVPSIVVNEYQNGKDFNIEQRCDWIANELYEYITRIKKQ